MCPDKLNPKRAHTVRFYCAVMVFIAWPLLGIGSLHVSANSNSHFDCMRAWYLFIVFETNYSYWNGCVVLTWLNLYICAELLLLWICLHWNQYWDQIQKLTSTLEPNWTRAPHFLYAAIVLKCYGRTILLSDFFTEPIAAAVVCQHFFFPIIFRHVKFKKILLSSRCCSNWICVKCFGYWILVFANFKVTVDAENENAVISTSLSFLFYNIMLP